MWMWNGSNTLSPFRWPVVRSLTRSAGPAPARSCWQKRPRADFQGEGALRLNSSLKEHESFHIQSLHPQRSRAAAVIWVKVYTYRHNQDVEVIHHCQVHTFFFLSKWFVMLCFPVLVSSSIIYLSGVRFLVILSFAISKPPSQSGSGQLCTLLFQLLLRTLWAPHIQLSASSDFSSPTCKHIGSFKLKRVGGNNRRIRKLYLASNGEKR